MRKTVLSIVVGLVLSGSSVEASLIGMKSNIVSKNSSIAIVTPIYFVMQRVFRLTYKLVLN